MMATTAPRDVLTLAEARRVALAAQGFGAPRPGRAIGMRDVQGVIDRVGQFQIDSVSVVARAHYLPLYSRLGPYDVGLLDRAAGLAPRRLFEYWGHAASLIDVRLQPALRFRMQPEHRSVWPGVARAALEHPELAARLLDDVRRLGPVTARQIELAETRRRTNWGWNWSTSKMLLEWMFATGEITVARRNSQFEREYDLPERVLPVAVAQARDPELAESMRTLVRVAARALGVATETCLRDYFRTAATLTRAAIGDLVDSGELLPVRVEGWSERPTYLWHRATVPRRLTPRALLSPFDSLVFERSRLERLFGFHYRIEIYVPEAKRLHGYYVYPFLLGERFVARVDLKADRAAGVLRVNAAWIELGVDPDEVAGELAAELRTMADWLGLVSIAVSERGDLAAALASACARDGPTRSHSS